MKRAWVLNVGVELELAGRGTSEAISRRIASVRRELATTLPGDDVVLDVHDDAAARGREGRCWCPTPRALARMEEAHVVLPPAPPLDVLRRVNARRFSAEIHSMPEARSCATVEDARRGTERPGRWLLLRDLGFAGRGRRLVDAGSWDSGAEGWARGALREGPIHVLPKLEIEADFGLHGLVDEGAGLTARGAPTVAEVDRDGQWKASRLARPGELSAEEIRALSDTLERAAAALVDAGYFGPFGIDAFRHRGGFHALSEINARYSMGWAIGMGGWR